MSRIVVLCDGTWCGREAGTESNILRLARLIGIHVAHHDSEDQYTRTNHNVKARYRHGVGLNSTFLDYLFDGATAQDIATECIRAYEFIVEHYTADHEVWLFGLSRGAYTVRCVAGMINNCGIVRRRHSPEETRLLCKEVYRIYRSRYVDNSPHSEQSKNFRERNSWPLIGDEADGELRRQPPIRFMGLFDTVGSLGIPTFTGGVGLDWPQFYDNIVSSVVRDVGHLVSLHDRFWMFEPCLASRKDRSFVHGIREDPSRPGIQEEWIPGVHYDLGRQRFRFFRTGASKLEGWLAKWSLANKVIEPNEVLADLALVKMLLCIRQHDPDHTIIPADRMADALRNLRRAMTARQPTIGDGDVYANIAAYLPFGSMFGPIFRAFFRMAPAIWELLLALRDRLIPLDQVNVYNYTSPDDEISTALAVADIAGVTDERYPSKTPQSWALRTGLVKV